ncbi:hypothetical protein DKX38_007405 [Salix brachista]|uniref:Histone-binding protein RBBP4-like N-terminal domain-containing protein n=1 Tax=Salix brachista TaxID=2182728 RepID=A0A5N5MQP3_9ROSI|nr:hypothetical protein DKX38_007405 [Salix brachista]
MVRSIKNPKKAKRKNKVWQPGVDKLGEEEELECDPTAYNSLHAFHIGWPCLSFDVVRDSLGLLRTDFPHTVYFVAGSQAEKPDWNSIGILKVSNVSGKQRDLVPSKTTDGDSDMDADNSDSDEDSEDEEEGGSVTPVLQLRKVAHGGCINRIRAMTQNPHICASWSDAGYVQSETEVPRGASSVFNQAPLFNFKGHKDEGYAIDWSPRVAGRLVTGDCKNCIHLWEPASDATWNVDATPFTGHTASVEDLQVYHVFASCSVDGHIAIWDARLGKSPAIYFKAHSADVNVISWNSWLVSCWHLELMMEHFLFVILDCYHQNRYVVSDVCIMSFCLKNDIQLHFRITLAGLDTILRSPVNVFRCHLLLDFSSCCLIIIYLLCQQEEDKSLVAHFQYHNRPITSIEWSPHEASTLAVSSSDNQLTIWDLSLEKDEEEEAEFKAKTKEQVNGPADLPPQLLFVHQGQKDLKELQWHAQIPGMIVSTASDGFNILMPSL